MIDLSALGLAAVCLLLIVYWPKTLHNRLLILALLGSIDTLLTSLVADSITRGRHDADKELVGQGIGNTTRFGLARTSLAHTGRPGGP